MFKIYWQFSWTIFQNVCLDVHFILVFSSTTVQLEIRMTAPISDTTGFIGVFCKEGAFSVHNLEQTTVEIYIDEVLSDNDSQYVYDSVPCTSLGACLQYLVSNVLQSLPYEHVYRMLAVRNKSITWYSWSISFTNLSRTSKHFRNTHLHHVLHDIHFNSILFYL